MKVYAVIDPYWGDPRPVLATVRATSDEAWEAAEHCEALALYSGRTAYPLPRGKAGSRKKLREAGFDVSPFSLEELNTAS